MIAVFHKIFIIVKIPVVTGPVALMLIDAAIVSLMICYME